MQMLPQHVCRSAAPARPGHAGTPCRPRVAAGRRVAASPAPRLRASCRVTGGGGSGGTTEPVPASQAVAEELESLEAAAIAGEDEGRRPTDYDRRAHIFEESSRVFRELKERRDDGDVRGGGGGVQGGGDGTATQQLG